LIFLKKWFFFEELALFHLENLPKFIMHYFEKMPQIRQTLIPQHKIINLDRYEYSSIKGFIS